MDDLKGLTRDEWESLGHDLCATMYDTERVEDRLGRGNGLDAIRQLEPNGNVDGWQFRRFNDRLGYLQITKLKEAVTRAVSACKKDLNGDLKTFTVFGNIDLQPGHLKAKGEDARFSDFQKWCKTEYDIKAIYRGVNWVHSCLLKHPHLRPNLFEDLAGMMELAKQEILNAVGGDADTRKAFEELKARSAGQLEVLVTEARTHFERGKQRGENEDWRLAVESLRDAERLASAPGVEKSLLPLIRSLLAGFLTITGPLNDALQTGRLAVAAAKDDSSLLRFAQGNLAIALTEAQEFEEGRSLFLEVLRAYDDSAEISEVVRTLTHLLHIDTSTKNWSGAFIWAKRLEDKCTRLERMIGITEDSLNALGSIATFRFNVALEFPQPLQDELLTHSRVLFQQLIESSRLSNMRRTMIIAETQLGNVLNHLRQFDDSDNVLQRAIEDADSNGLAKVAADSRYNQAVMLMEAGRLNQAANAAADAISRYGTLGDAASMKDVELLLENIRANKRKY